MRNVIVAGMLLLGMTGCSTVQKYQAGFTRVQTLSVLRPMVDLEMFPEGRALESPAERRQTQRVLESELHIQLYRHFRFVQAPELASDIPQEVQTLIRALWVELQATPDLTTITLAPALKAFLKAHPGDGAMLIMYYRGFQRSRESMTEGYHNSAFQTELVPRAYAREVNAEATVHFPHELGRGRYVAVPERFNATLKWVVIQKETLAPIYYDSRYVAEDPQTFATAQSLVRTLADAMRTVRH